jgi:hypothetical protein
MSRTLPNVIRNTWRTAANGQVMVAGILNHRTTPEGLDVERVRFIEAGSHALDETVGHLVSVLSGEVTLLGGQIEDRLLRLTVTAHAYIPPGRRARIEAPAGAELLHVAGATAAQSRGDRLLVRDETFLAACATTDQTLRWILTSQYLSRRIFLHHDAPLLSKSGAPVSWYRTTMFDVAGLPPGDDGEPVFKMAYNSRTEFNVCYQVLGRARVRMAEHPYRDGGQVWGPWLSIDGESTYHVNEASGGDEEEVRVDRATGQRRTFRNKHEVSIADGHVTLFCLFDPAPTGIERHRPGTYSDYEALADVLGTPRYETYIRDVVEFDAMVDVLSMAQARGELRSLRGSAAWRLYERGRQAQAAQESALLDGLVGEGAGRERIVAPWTTMTARP